MEIKYYEDSFSFAELEGLYDNVRQTLLTWNAYQLEPRCSDQTYTWADQEIERCEACLERITAAFMRRVSLTPWDAAIKARVLIARAFESDEDVNETAPPLLAEIARLRPMKPQTA